MATVALRRLGTRASDAGLRWRRGGPARDDACMPPPAFLPLRRTCVAAIALGPVFIRDLRAQPRLAPTPSQTEGPFYPVDTSGDTDFDLLQRAGHPTYARGRPVWLDGTVTDTAGRPLAGAQVEIWQCDEQGHYHHPGDGGRADPSFQGFGRVTLDREGRYRFHTIRPAPYSGRTPHIHVKVRNGGRELLTTQLYVAGEARNARDGLWRSLSAAQRERLTMPFVESAEGLAVRFPIVVEG
jgi:protocatechuate 3,4-dioxygenase beta subunit